MLHYFFRFLSFLILKFYGNIRAFGRENIPKKGGFLLVSNHMSYFDPMAVGVSCPRPLNYMARHDLFNNSFFAWVIRNSGAFPVKRDTADLSALKEAIKRVKSGGGLLLFPEGRRITDTTASVEPEPGVGFLISKLQVPVIPVFVKGTDKVWPKGAKKIAAHQINVYFGEQISVERRMPYQDIARQVMGSIRHLGSKNFLEEEVFLKTKN
ncbi:MAG: 1-acyl-sn-glycerol-3-phosphate acyltransferase [Candidatus Omnitrophica bacterium]|nr:1-acyl-sn-glycerol-3-phosphate acyltransferase [Candidatus Omnitrophota bacterium]